MSQQEIQRKQRAIFELETWHVAVDLRVADELLALRRGSCVHRDMGRSLQNVAHSSTFCHDGIGAWYPSRKVHLQSFGVL